MSKFLWHISQVLFARLFWNYKRHGKFFRGKFSCRNVSYQHTNNSYSAFYKQQVQSHILVPRPSLFGGRKNFRHSFRFISKGLFGPRFAQRVIGHAAKQYEKIRCFILRIVTFHGSCVSSPCIIASFFLSIRSQCSKLGIFREQSLMLF